jgi:hypothetical protein
MTSVYITLVNMRPPHPCLSLLVPTSGCKHKPRETQLWKIWLVMSWLVLPLIVSSPSCACQSMHAVLRRSSHCMCRRSWTSDAQPRQVKLEVMAFDKLVNVTCCCTGWSADLRSSRLLCRLALKLQPPGKSDHRLCWIMRDLGARMRRNGGFR